MTGAPSLGDAAFRAIAKAIVRGILTEGEQLRDQELADRLHMSRTPVREALQRLERAGLVEILPSRMTRVTAVTAASRRLALLNASYQAGFVAHMSVPLLTPEEREAAAALVDRMDATLGDPVGSSEARRTLYAFLSKRSRNPLNRAHLRDLEPMLRRNLAMLAVPPEHHPSMREVHAGLRAAIRSGDAVAAEQHVRAQYALLVHAPDAFAER